MKRPAARPLQALALLLAAYLCAPFLASLPQIEQADWAGVDWRTTLGALATSCASASAAALLILLGGVPLGYWLARASSRAMSALGFVVQLPLALPPLASGVLLLFLFGPYSLLGGLTGGALTDSFGGIVCAEMFVAAPFLIVAARSAFAAADPVYEDVAATLGHGAAGRFFRVALPAAWPAIRAGLALAWLRAFGEFGATVMLAYHPYSLPVYTYVVFGGQGLPAMMPLLLPTLAIAGVCAILSMYRRAAPSRAPVPAPPEPGDEPAVPDAGRIMPAGPSPQLSIRLRRQLGDFRLDLDWAPTQRRLAVIGPSGSGKSLALRLIAGLERNESGCVRLGAAELGGLPPERRQIAYMPQDYGLFPHLDVARQLAFPIDADPAVARYWAGHLGLNSLLARLPHQLSLGQRQRVALARALTRHSHLLLFDEPFAALDTPRRRHLQRALRALQRDLEAVTIIVTHDPDEAALLADEVLVIDQGRVLQAGPVEQVFARPASLRVADLLGLRNVAEGVVSAPGCIASGAGLLIEVGDSALGVGRRVIWRAAAGALRLARENVPGMQCCAARIASVELRGGERYARIEAGGVLLDVALDGMDVRENETCVCVLDPRGITVWPAQTLRPAPL